VGELITIGHFWLTCYYWYTIQALSKLCNACEEYLFGTIFASLEL